MDPKAALLAKLTRIFADAVVDEDERSGLRAFLASGELSASETKEVFESFVETTWKATNEDGIISEIELQRLREIIRVLQLDASVLPKAWLDAVRK
jgi:tellurite resistance protein